MLLLLLLYLNYNISKRIFYENILMRREHNNVNEKIETEKAPTNFQNRPRQTSPSPEKKKPEKHIRANKTPPY